MDINDTVPVKRDLRFVTVAGCLAMVYITCISSPVTTEFYRQLGATDFDFGILGGIPMIMLFMQFVGAYLTGMLHHRKPWFLVLVIAARLFYLVIAGLAFMPGLLPNARIKVILLMVALSGALANLMVPLWFSWMGDLIPKRILNRYFGSRQRYMTICWTVVYIGIALFTKSKTDLSVNVIFLVLVTIGCFAGVIDILLFIWVREPQNITIKERNFWEIILEPLRSKGYRNMVLYRCMFSFSTMIAASFFQIYLLKVIKMPLWLTIVIWGVYGIGNALVSTTWGRITDLHGHRPVMILCMMFKPVVCLAFALVTPASAFYVLILAFLLDSMLNSGLVLAWNGYMLKMAPKENRSMFIAALTALAGIVGGVGAIAGGYIMKYTDWFHPELLGREWTNFQLLFIISFVLRALCIIPALKIHEPESSKSIHVINYLSGLWPMRMVMFPIGLYRKIRNLEELEENQSD